MKCPTCNKLMKKVGWRITNNGRDGDAFKEYDKTTYKCESDDAWVETDLPVEK